MGIFDLRDLLQTLAQAGYRIERTASGRYNVYAQDGEWVATVAGDTSDLTGMRNALRRLRALGFRWPER